MDMDRDRPHFRTTSTGSSSCTTTAAASTSELFICFTSRLSSSSSSMKLSKSILSPARAARDGGSGGPNSLSSSLSRRLRSNGSLKGGASPFFTTTTGNKKRGCAFENPEPSSPKVTCIGQVRVKTKKKVKQSSRSLSKRRSGEVSFRRIEQQAAAAAAEGLPQRNQRWVHLPVSICEALSSCLFPCKSSCFSSSEREKLEKQSGSENGCGAVFRWLVSVNDGEGGKRREIELVVGGGDEAEERVSVRSSRRHVFEDIEVKDDRIEVKGEEEEEGRVSICVPPKNALLLMRCRSDPMKMADLAQRFSWDAHAGTGIEKGDVCEEENEVISEECEGKEEVIEQDSAAVLMEINEEQEIMYQTEIEAKLEEELVISSEKMVEEEETEKMAEEETETERIVEEEEETEKMGEEETELQEEIMGYEDAFSEEHRAEAAEEEEEEEDEEEDDEEGEEEDEEEVESNMSSFEDLLDQENAEQFEDCPIQDKDEAEETTICHLSPQTESDEEEEHVQSNIQPPPSLVEEEEEEEQFATEQETEQESNTPQKDKEQHDVTTATQPETLIHGEKEEEYAKEEEKEETTISPENQEPVTSYEEPKKAKENQVLPECLLLMMCEPKLSMEVSKETWVCSTDFLRWLPERPRKPAAKPGGGCAPRRLSIDSKVPKHITTTHHAPPPSNTQPPRSSCTLPAAAAAASMATMIEQKLVNAVGYEPFVLTRCKSEPMRTAAAKLMPESCFWKNAVRKLEPHRRAALGVGAAGVGF